MSEESDVRLSREEACGVYLVLAGRGEASDSVLGRLLGRLEAYLYRTMTIEEIEALRRSMEGTAGAGPRRGA
jgi:hypothetical protein